MKGSRPLLDIDWPRTILTGAITLGVFAAIYIADVREALAAGEEPAVHAAIIAGGVTGVVLGLLFANAVLT